MRRAVVIALLCSVVPAPLLAQAAWVGVSAGMDVQRFSEDTVPNRLDGESLGASIFGGILLFGRMPILGEWVHAGTMQDTATTTVEINAQPVDIASTFQHRTRTLAVLAGFEHAVGRARLAYLAGMQRTEVAQRFQSNAASIVLVTPSAPGVIRESLAQHRFVTPAAGAHVTLPVARTLRLISGVRIHPMPMPLEIDGWSVRVYGGAAWQWQF
jgi:hypothetical protein